MTPQAISILPFSDYRTFLAAHAQEMKRRNTQWSLGAWARHIGLKTTSSLTKVINGERNPGENISNRLIQYFRFDSEEERHFRDLVSFQKLKKHPEVNAFLIQKLAAKKEAGGFAHVDEATFSTLSEWYYFAVREMVNLDTFLEDPNWISQTLQFSVAPLEIRKAISKLIQVGLLKRDAKDRLQLADARIDTTNDVASEAIKRYHEQSLENAKTAIRTVPVDHREFTSTTLVIDPKDLPAAKEMIRKFREFFGRSMEKKKGERVYQLEMALFPVTRSL